MRRPLNLLTALSLMLCVVTWVLGALARGRTYLLVSQSPGASHIAGILELKAILWLEDRRDPDIMVITLDRWTTGAGFLYGSRGQAYRVLAVPHWPVVALAAATPALRLYRTRRQRRRARSQRCMRCGYDLRATPERCPECGNHAA